MQVIETIAAFRQVRSRYTGLGFVPTMGYLHEGHLSLVHRAKEECGAVAVSIFVNPTQFGPNEDFAGYPRDPKRDLELLEKEQVDLVFTPSPGEIYPPGSTTVVEVGDVTEMLEGAARPGHFRGVATIVCKLFNIVQASRAYFGQKDDERRAAVVLYRALTAAEKHFGAGERSSEALRRIMHDTLATEPQADIEYISLADRDTLRELDRVPPRGALASLAMRIGKTRLIDNCILEK